MSFSAGIDIGSSTIKLAVLKDGAIVHSYVAPSTAQPLGAARTLLASLEPDTPLVATGYGRDLVDAIRPTQTISEIKAHALGARFLFPGCRSVVDVGGQDVKVIALDANGKAARFEMNDRCAAGTGRFLEVMANKLECSFEEFGNRALAGSDGLKINALCTVFAESEVIGLLNRGCSSADIARSLLQSMVARIKTMFFRVEALGPVFISGGGAKNRALVSFLQEALSLEVVCSEQSQIAGAIGCAACTRS